MSVQRRALEDSETREAARLAALQMREELQMRDKKRAKDTDFSKALRDKVTYQALRTVQENQMPSTKIGLCEGLNLEIDARSQGLLQICREKDLEVVLKPVVRQEGIYYVPVKMVHKFQALSASAYVCVAQGELNAENAHVVSYYYIVSEVIGWVYMKWTARGTLLENCPSTYIRSQMIEFFKYADQGMPYWSAHEEEFRQAIARAETVLPPLDTLLEY